MKRLGAYLRRPRDDRRLLRQAATAWLGVRWRLRRGRSGQTVQQALAERASKDGVTESPEQITWAAVAWCQAAPGTNLCLVQALVAQRLLLEHGHTPRLHLGARQVPGEGFGAHAWLELDGEILVGAVDDLDDFRPFGGAP